MTNLRYNKIIKDTPGLGIHFCPTKLQWHISYTRNNQKCETVQQAAPSLWSIKEFIKKAIQGDYPLADASSPVSPVKAQKEEWEGLLDKFESGAIRFNEAEELIRLMAVKLRPPKRTTKDSKKPELTKGYNISTSSTSSFSGALYDTSGGCDGGGC